MKGPSATKYKSRWIWQGALLRPILVVYLYIHDLRGKVRWFGFGWIVGLGWMVGTNDLGGRCLWGGGKGEKGVGYSCIG